MSDGQFGRETKGNTMTTIPSILPNPFVRPVKATAKQVREHYKAQGLQVSIQKDGHVSYRVPFGDALWREGRYVSEYRIIDGQVVLT